MVTIIITQSIMKYDSILNYDSMLIKFASIMNWKKSGIQKDGRRIINFQRVLQRF